MKRFIVYKHTNINNGKAYIGITSIGINKRWNSGHGYDLQPKFNHAIKKHGAKSFKHEILAKDLTKKEACELEKMFIAKYDTINNGYNVSVGGMDMKSAYDKVMVDKYNPETGELICSYKSIMDAAFDVNASDSHISEACRGKFHVIAGYGWAYHGQKWEKPKKYRHSRCKVEKVDQETGIVLDVYNTLKEAAEMNGISVSMISMCCNGKCKKGGGFLWRYNNESLNRSNGAVCNDG